MQTLRVHSPQWRLTRSVSARAIAGGRGPYLAFAAAGILAALLWSYWTTLHGLFRDWRNDPNYSVGQLVPFAALYMLWNDRRTLSRLHFRPCQAGALLVIAAQILRAYGLFFLYESAERYALVITVAGLFLWVGGREVFRETRWILAFLWVMIPLPGRIHNLISAPLQSAATAGAVFLLELLGVTITREGHVVVLNDTITLAVAEACSGLRMLTAFVVVGCVLAYVVERPRWQKNCLILSTIPVAILCNLIRLVITALMFLWVGGEWAERFFHDFAGWTMMPMAVLLLAAELWVMSRLIVQDRATPDSSFR